MKAKKLIEVALPIKEISAESVRDNRLAGGNIRTLHIWWARRPLPTCRAVVFASLVPDPLDKYCPQAFKDAVFDILMTDKQYAPYKDIPYTAVYDPMEDNMRNRLMMFIGKFSPLCQENMKVGKKTAPANQLDSGSLIKWENHNNEVILRKAQKLIWVAYNSELHTDDSYSLLSASFEKYYNNIRKCEDALYSNIIQNLSTSNEIDCLEKQLHDSIKLFMDKMPAVFDPFAGGGAIPLEAARLGCRSYGNDLNPVAHIIEKGSAEFPQKYGKPIIFSRDVFEEKYGDEGLALYREKEGGLLSNDTIKISNRLSFDIEFYARKLIKEAKDIIGDKYPNDNYGNVASAYYWARTAKCSNPACGAEVPLLRNFYLANTDNKKVYLRPIINGTKISFEIAYGKYNPKELQEWNHRGTLSCPCCGSITSVNELKKQAISVGLKPRLLAIIAEGNTGKVYSLPTSDAREILTNTAKPPYRPSESMTRNSNGGDTFPWGFSRWGDLFSDRNLCVIGVFLQTFDKLKKALPKTSYNIVLMTYIGIWIDRIIQFSTSFSRWNDTAEKIQHLYGRQAISMLFDYSEPNPFCKSSGSALNQLDWIIKYIESESFSPFYASFRNASSGDKLQFENKFLTAVITDPPYYDAIAYSDCSDFFYVWLKHTIGDMYPINFSTPLTPKAEECTALKYHHDGDDGAARIHFEKKLTEIFDTIEVQTEDIVSIMYAHQSTEAWTTLCNSILSARMNITSSWALDTEMAGGLKTDKAYLESSVTVGCRPSERKGYGDYKVVKKNIEKKVSEEVEYLYELGFRGADLLTACFGQAVSEFGKYKSVEKSDGSEVTVAELLEMARNAAFDSLLKGVQGDDFTKFYIGWLQLNGTGETDFDDATKFTRVGVNVNIKDIQQDGLLILEGKKIHIAMAEEHLGKSSVVGTRPEDSPISQAHRFIVIYREGDRGKILHFVRDICPEASSPLWRLLATLKELLPANDDQKQISSILQNAEDLRQHCHDEYHAQEGDLFEGFEI